MRHEIRHFQGFASSLPLALPGRALPSDPALLTSLRKSQNPDGITAAILYIDNFINSL